LANRHTESSTPTGCSSPRGGSTSIPTTTVRPRGTTFPEYLTARLYGLTDRGTVEPGVLADLNVIDYDRLQLGSPRVTTDLPAGGRRLLQDATGYVATVKAGVTTFDDGNDTGARPGRLVRGAR
jgi:N-acyl-D-aspartate/D-glutamate deacylase